MAAEILIEVGLGAAVESLLKAISRAKGRAFKFEAILSKLEDTLKFLRPKVKNIEELKKSIDIPTDEIQKLNQRLANAEEIVNRCSKIGRWNYCKKCRYSKILLKLDASLREIFGTEVQVEIWEDVKKILVKLEEVNKKLDESMAVPVLYVKNEDELRSRKERMRMQAKRLYEMVDDKVFKRMKNKMAKVRGKGDES